MDPRRVQIEAEGFGRRRLARTLVTGVVDDGEPSGAHSLRIVVAGVLLGSLVVGGAAARGVATGHLDLGRAGPGTCARPPDPTHGG